ncbi:arsenate reductase/protein-tyrosine-phosphatase family protein [Falsiruegeria mediterranea]|jgi:ArsR family transcriptional regulator, arsenate/arsenite/antimonite-responsive transcriptional repressor / arsenate reductase (thioredoxin)|uniref:Glutaredoxin arsenate reductase n=1 Tax=Falsiruegeria mediterranea M17 TaxID=1200281 RepID=A0A2R8CBS3_9RHOB|nr:helix-turn-helix domain-containing protein [Falsiruegeria mediterranea]SPJ29838.1 Glutaredoxin arsenate reductase [Falsiruegeria mediterranea M17]
MEIAIHDKLSALAHPNRLEVFRLLMRRYPDAVPAGQIAQALDLKPNTASVYLSALKKAGLIEQTRTGTSLQYTTNLGEVRGLFDGLLGGCCQSRPDLCVPTTLPETPIMTDTTRRLNALFICTGNSARSLMAESILRTEGLGRFNAFSAGTMPSGQPHPKVIELLGSKGHDIGQLRSKSVDEFNSDEAPKMDFVFTVCDHAANEECPTWPGQPMSAHWGLPDPVKAGGTDAQRNLAFQQAYGLLRNRITAFVSLPFETLDRISLQHQIDDIGRQTDASEPE